MITISDFQRKKLEREAKKNWDLFYKRNGDRFFKNRFWTRHEFAELFQDDAKTDAKSELSYRPILLEIGCGCGDFALPLLDTQQDQGPGPGHQNQTQPIDMFIFCCDISSKAIEILRSKPSFENNHPQSIEAFVADISELGAAQLLQGLQGKQVDFVSLIFVLSALDPENITRAVNNIRLTLKPGGMVLFRDYAINDKAMLRFSTASKICNQFYARQDGTRAYFFEKFELEKIFLAAGFTCQSIHYVMRETINNASQVKFSRTFLQAKFIKNLE